MAAKNVNFFEQHVEKIVLALAVAGAGFLGYLAIQPITIPTPDAIKAQVGKEEMGPNDLEESVTAQLNVVEKQQANLPAPDSKVSDPRQKWGKLDIPSPPAVAIGPANMGLKPVATTSNNPQDQLATPNPVGPEYLHAEARQEQVAVVQAPPGGAAGGAVAPAAGMVVQTRTQNYVAIDGYVPIGKVMLDLLQDKAANIAAGQGIQRAQIYRISVERSEQTPAGWSDWKAVPPTKASPAPTEINFGAMKDGDLASAMDVIDTEFKQILLPDFYQDGQNVVIQPPILSRPIPPKITDEQKTLQEELDKAKAPTGFRPVAPAPVPGAPAAAPAWPIDITVLRTMAVVPFTFYDDTVEPNHTYRYRVEVKIVNPTYGWRWGLKNPKMKTEPFLTTGKVVIPGSVTVLSDLVFFLSGVDSRNAVSGVIFRQNNGKWYRGDITAFPGQKIESKITLADEANKVMEVDTGFTVVDAVPGQGNVHVILKDPTGNLVTRETREDWIKADRTALGEKVQKPGAAATTTAPGGEMTIPTPPQTTPARGPVRGPPVTPTPGRGQ